MVSFNMIPTFIVYILLFLFLMLIKVFFLYIMIFFNIKLCEKVLTLVEIFKIGCPPKSTVSKDTSFMHSSPFPWEH